MNNVYAVIALVVLVAGIVWKIDDRAYDSGKAAGADYCAKTTVPLEKAAVQKTCDDNAKLTKDENHALHTRLDRLDADNQRLLATPPAIGKCVPVARPAGGSAGANAPAGDSERVGVNTEWLDRAFYDANRDIIAGESCQRTLEGIYRLNGQASKLPH